MDNGSRNLLDSLVGSQTLDDEQMDLFPHVLMLIDENRVVLKANKLAKNMGVEIGKYCWDTFGQCGSIPEADKEFFEATGTLPTGGTKCTFCAAGAAISLAAEQVKPVAVGKTKWSTYWVPVGDGTYLHFGIEKLD